MSELTFPDDEFHAANSVVSEQWCRIGEIYPQTSKGAILPERLERAQFEQGYDSNCLALVAMAVLVDHRDVIDNVMVTKTPNAEGRYAFRFFRQGVWEELVIDDRIPLTTDLRPLYIESPTKHWWPLLLHKALAKLYRRYENLEGCSLHEVLVDVTGHPVLTVPLDPALAKAIHVDLHDSAYWLDQSAKIEKHEICAAALSCMTQGKSVGLLDGQSYGVLGVHSLKQAPATKVDDLVVRLYNPFEDVIYSGPFHLADKKWTPELKARLQPTRNVFFMPLAMFLKHFVAMDVCIFKGLNAPASRIFSSEWKGDEGNPTFSSFRKNPKFVVCNMSSESIDMVVMLSQRDRHAKSSDDHGGKLLPYNSIGLTMLQADFPEAIRTPHVTLNNHKVVFQGLFVGVRDVCNKMTVPPSSLCYLVPSSKSPIQERFSLLVFEQGGHAPGVITIEPLEPNLLDLLHPAVERLVLTGKDAKRLDFVADCATDLHVLLTQPRQASKAGVGDLVAANFFALYLLDENENQLAFTPSATNFQEIGLVRSVLKPGRYFLRIVCVQGAGSIAVELSITARCECPLCASTQWA